MPEDFDIISPQDLGALPIGTALTGGVFSFTTAARVSYKIEPDVLLDLFSPKPIVASVSPFGADGQVATGIERQYYFHEQAQNAKTLYQWQGNTWKKLTAWGPTATDLSPNTLPVVTLAADKNSLTLGNKITLTATATDPDGSIVQVELFVGKDSLGKRVSLPYAFTYTPTVAGMLTFAAIATDNSGASSGSVPVQVSVAAAGVNPAIVTLEVPTLTVQVGKKLPLTANVVPGTYGVADVSFFDAATNLTTISSLPYAYEWTPATVGTHSLTARVVDENGGVSISPAVTVTVTGAPVEPLPTPDAPTFTGFADTNEGGSITLVTATGVPLSDYRVALPGSNSFAAVANDLITFGNVAGTVRAYSVATSARNQSPTATSQAFTTYTPPNNQTPSITAFTVSTASITAGDPLTFTAAASDPDGSVASIQIYEGGNLVAGITGASGTTTAIFPTAGSHTYSARATDNQNLQGPLFGTTRTVAVAAPPPSFNRELNPGEQEGYITYNPQSTVGSKLCLNTPIPDGDPFPATCYIYEGPVANGVFLGAIDANIPLIGTLMGYKAGGVTRTFNFIDGDVSL